jgi:hypothetical protein
MMPPGIGREVPAIILRSAAAIASDTVLILPPGCVQEWQPEPGIDRPAGEFYDPVAHCRRITTGNIAVFGLPTDLFFTETSKDAYLPSGEGVRHPELRNRSIRLFAGTCVSLRLSFAAFAIWSFALRPAPALPSGASVLTRSNPDAQP